MPNLLASFESALQLQIFILGCGLSAFCAGLACGAGPLCTWLEWTDCHCGSQHNDSED